MITLTGKYNSANIMIDDVDQETISQIYSFLNHPAFAGTYIAIMPDCHAGAGAVIGYTAKMNSYVIPNVVGVDIGCGIEAYKLTGVKEINLEKFDDFVKKTIPAGFAKRNKPVVKELGVIAVAPLEEIVSKTKQDSTAVLHSLGTLGGGNHFIEVDRTDSGDLWLVIHTGSRHFGLSICNYHQEKAKELMQKMFVGASAYKGLEYLPLELGGNDYLHDMNVAQIYATLNRHYIAADLMNWLNVPYNYALKGVESVGSIHNYIGVDNIIRKGAVSAYKDSRLIIPFNMRDGVAICRGKGSKKWNFSAPHGAGRIMSRSKAKKELALEKFQQEMLGIYTTTVNQSTIDESPMAYKDKDTIINAIGETVEIEFFMKPIYSFKAGGD